MNTQNTSNFAPEALTEVQTKSMNNFMESTQKFQKAMMGGHLADKGTGIYNEWLQGQFNIMNAASSGAATATTNNTLYNQDYYKNWYTNQMSMMKNMVDSNQGFYNQFLNFGKSTQATQDSYGTMNSAWTGMYNNYMSTINNMYTNMNNMMPNSTTKDAFTTMFQTQNVYLKMQELMQPVITAMQSMKTGNCDMDAVKNMFDMNQYKTVTEKMFEGFYPTNNNFKPMFESYIKNIESYFTNNTTTQKDFTAQYHTMFQNWPSLMGADFNKMNGIMNTYTTNVFGKTMEPMLNMLTPSSEKSQIEATINIVDKMMSYYTKQAQMQYLLYTASQKSAEQSIASLTEKMKNTTGTEPVNFQEFFAEWVSSSEKIYTDLFASDEFSTAKSELLNVSLGIKKDLESQFETQFAALPIVNRTEMDELYSTVHTLKNKIKELESQLKHTSPLTHSTTTGSTTASTTEEVKATTKKK
jgi:hypothetical protein